MAEQEPKLKRKLARRQVETPVTGHEERHDPSTFNIWTGRKLKEFRGGEKKGSREVSKYRCRPQLDTGWTRGQGMDVSYCCLYFARGLCHHGSDCNYLHRVPTEADEATLRCDYGHDIFGRERAPASRDGRKKGVGSYERECRTLYVHYGGAGPTPVLELRQLLQKNFGEWGPIEDVHIVPDKTIAFIRYSWRSSAEFAKVAMHQQSLDGSRLGEVLDVRWANDDPNPRTVERVKREREEAYRDAYLQAVMHLPPEQKQARLMQLNLQANVRPGCSTSQYPDTDAQYSHTYEGWDQYYYQGPDAQQRYEQHFYPGQRQHSIWASGEAGADGAGKGVDDISRYLPPKEHAWQQSVQLYGEAAEALYGEDGGQQEAAAEFTPDLTVADPQQQHLLRQQGEDPSVAAASAAAYPGAATGRVAHTVQQGHMQPVQAAGAGEENGGEPGAPADPAAAAEEALGLIGGYGSSSDED